MVNPSWESFKRPNRNSQIQDEIPQQENDQQQPQQNFQEKKTSEKKIEWGDFKTPVSYQGEPNILEDQGWFEYIGKNALANASRVAEQSFGRYGNIEKFAKDTLVNFPKVGGIIPWAISELMGQEKWERLIKGRPDQEHQLFPTSQQIKTASEKLSGGLTKAQTPGQEKFQEFTEDVAASYLGGKKSPAPMRSQAKQMTINHLLIPAAANVTKQIVKETGFGEDKANLAKTAVWLPLFLAGNISAPQHASHLMNEGRNGLPNTLQSNVPRFTQRLDSVSNSNFLLHSDPRSAIARELLSGVRKNIANGQTNIQSLMTTYDGINAAKRSRGLFELGKQSDRTFARKAIDEVRNAVRDEIMDVGANHPKALESWRNGVQAWSVIHQSNAVTNWIEDVAKGPYAKILTGPTAALFGIGSLGTVKSPLVSLTGAAAAPAAYKTGQTLYRMWNDERLASYYWKAYGAASEQNLPVFLSNYNKLDKERKKLDSVEKKSKRKK